MSKDKAKYCEYCLPQKRRNHIIPYLSYYFDNFRHRAFRGSSKKQPRMWPILLETLALFGLVKFEPNPDKKRLFNRSLIFFEEAKRRNIDIYSVKILGIYTNDFKFKFCKKAYYYEGIPTFATGKHNYLIDDKSYFKKILKAESYPHPAGNKFTKKNDALLYAKRLKGPFVIKPINGSLSQHASYPVEKNKLSKAIDIVKKYSPGFIMEEFIDGDLYRVTVINKKYVLVAKKIPPNIIGDGINSVKKLVNIKNNNRANSEIINKTLLKIVLDKKAIKHLSIIGLGINKVPKKGKIVYLSDKYVLSHGCDVVGCTKKIDPSTKMMFIELAKKIDSDLIGFDYITKDIEKGFKKQKSAIIEANSMPFVDLHQNPSGGESDKVAEIIWNEVLDGLVKL